MTEPALVLSEVSSFYTDEPVIREFSLAVAPGSIVTLIGGNGAGKSTLLRTIAGLMPRTTGSIRWEGGEIAAFSPHARFTRGIGFVPQGRCNFQRMSVRENMALGAHTLPKAESGAAVERMVALFPMLRRKWAVAAGNLSGGEQQILEMAMAMAVQPRLLLLDEPSLGLSPRMMFEVFDTVRHLRAAEGGAVTVVMVEQNVRGALAISDRAVVVELGRKFLEGEAKAVAADPRIRSAYLGGEPVTSEPRPAPAAR